MIISDYHEFKRFPDVRRSGRRTPYHARQHGPPAGGPGAVGQRPRGGAEAVASGIRDAKADNTRRAYDKGWAAFTAWADAHGYLYMPASPQAVALYLGHLAAEGKSLATISQARAAIPHFHAAGMQKGDNPARHPLVAEAMKGWRNQAAAPKQADALTAEALARVREVLRLPRRGRGEGWSLADTAQRRAALALAIIGALADGGLRRSEAAALTWGDVELWGDGTGRLTIQKSKNQPEPATVAVTENTARALREFSPAAPNTLSPRPRCSA